MDENARASSFARARNRLDTSQLQIVTLHGRRGRSYRSREPSGLIAHKTAAAATHRNDAVLLDGAAELARLLTVPDLLERVAHDVADDVVVVVATKGDVAVGVYFHGHEDGHTLVVTEASLVVVVVPEHILALAQLRHHDGRASPAPMRLLFHLAEPIEEQAVIEVLPCPDPPVMGLGCKPEAALEIRGVLARRLGIHPPRQIENLRVRVFGYEPVELQDMVQVVAGQARDREDVRES